MQKGIKFLQHKNDDYVWMQLCKEFFNLKEDYFLCYAYVPPANSSYYVKRNDDTMAHIESDIMLYSTRGQVMLCGDFNARTGNLADVIKNDSKLGLKNDIFYSVDVEIIKRSSQDEDHTCARGIRLVDICTASKLRIVNGRKTGDALGYYTCHKHAGSSVVDYLITSEYIFDQILYFYVNNFNVDLSDHCPISWAIQCQGDLISMYNENPKIENSTFPTQFKWNKECIFKFQQSLYSEDIRQLIRNIMNCDEQQTSDLLVEKASNIYVKSATSSLIVKAQKQNTKRKHKPWYDKTLMDMKKNVLVNSNLLQKYPNTPYIRFTKLIHSYF